MSDLEQASAYIEGRQFLRSVLSYMHSADFQPQSRLSLDEVKTMLRTKTDEMQLEELNNISPY